MIEVRQTREFNAWLSGLRDTIGRARIIKRIERLGQGNFGDVKYFDGIGELRFTFGPGYRAYFVRKGDVIVILLCGGGKGSQSADIARAKSMAEEA